MDFYLHLSLPKSLLFLFTILTLATSPQTLANQLISKQILNGKNINIYDDFTWTYSQDNKCETVSPTIYFCRERTIATPTRQLSKEWVKTYKLGSRAYAGYIQEEIGSADGVTLQAMGEIVIENAASAAETSIEDIIILGKENVLVDGKPSLKLSYKAELKGISFIFINTITVSKQQTIQTIFFQVGKQLTDDTNKLSNQIIRNTYFNFKA